MGKSGFSHPNQNSRLDGQRLYLILSSAMIGSTISVRMRNSKRDRFYDEVRTTFRRQLLIYPPYPTLDISWNGQKNYPLGKMVK